VDGGGAARERSGGVTGEASEWPSDVQSPAANGLGGGGDDSEPIS
jgi:hypothetical protein